MKPASRRTPFQIAFAGVMGALCITVMMAGSLFSVFIYVLPAVAGFAVAVVGIETGQSTGWLMYTAVSLLGLFIIPDKEMAAMFICFFGFYPLLQGRLNAIRPKGFSWGVKMALFCTLIGGVYCAVIFVLKVPGAVSEFATFTPLLFAGLLLLAGVTFIVYDLALERCLKIYMQVRKRFMKRIR